MNEGTYKAILLSSKDYKEYDKLLRMLTVEGGIITARMRGAKKPSAKLRFGAIPFAFCEYTLYKKNGMFLVTGCSQIEDLFSISADYESFTVGSLMLETADNAMGTGSSPEVFVLLLKSLKLLLYSEISPNIVAISFLQKLIHYSGYAYTYAPATKTVTTSLELLSLINSLDLDKIPLASFLHIDDTLIAITLKKLIKNFENKFDCEIKAKNALNFYLQSNM